MGQTVKAEDGTTWVVRRLVLPAPVSAANLMGAAVESTGSQQHGSSLIGLLLRGILVAVIGVVLLPFALVGRLVFRRWTVEAETAETTLRWKANTWGAAGAGVRALAGALEKGESLEGPFAGLKRL